MKHQILIIVIFFLTLVSCDKEKKDNIMLKTFINETTLNLDLIGKVKTVELVAIDFLVVGSTGEVYKGDFKGTIDSISLKFTESQHINFYNKTTHSIETFKMSTDHSKKNTYDITRENVLIASDEGVSSEDDYYKYLIQDWDYNMNLDDHNQLDLGTELRSNQYNSHGDKTKEIWNTQRDKEPKETNFYYKYDNKGNWIERIKVRTLNNNEKFELARGYRVITYYQ